MENINFIIAKNLVRLRKENGLTQKQLAEKLNYSDKAVSKWEQGDSIPGVEILHKISQLYDVGLSEIVSDEKPASSKKDASDKVRMHLIITCLSVLAVWLLAVIFYICFNIFAQKSFWIFYCWAVPVSTIVAIVFNGIWGTKKITFILVSVLIWVLLACFCIQFISFNIWVLMLAGIPLQLATILVSKLVK